MIETTGECEITIFDEANVPVDIWLTELDPKEPNSETKEMYSNGYRFALTISIYMPRKAEISPQAVRVYSDNKYELQKLVLDHVLPLYKAALAKINGILEGTDTHLYYWEV